MKIAIVGVICLAIVGSFAPANSQQKKPDPAVKALMFKKLKSSQTLLEGLALADYAKITTNAEELIELTKAEEWRVIRTPQYELFSNEFRRAAETIVLKAKAKSVDGATLGYMDLTMSCVRCHQYVRETRGG